MGAMTSKPTLVASDNVFDQRFEHMVTTSSLATELEDFGRIERDGWDLVCVVSYTARATSGAHGDTTIYLRHYWKRPCRRT